MRKLSEIEADARAAGEGVELSREDRVFARSKFAQCAHDDVIDLVSALREAMALLEASSPGGEAIEWDEWHRLRDALRARLGL